MAKGKHKYNIGDIVTFKFLTGDVYTGKITHQTFKNDGTPDYKIRVDEGKDKFTIYPCMTEKRIKRRDFTALQVMKLSEKKMKKEESKKEKLDLKQAIKQQTDFLNGETKK